MPNPVSVETAEHYLWGAHCDGWHLVRTPELSIIQERVPPGGREIRHGHARARQFFFVLEGEAVLEVEGRRHTLPARTGLEIAPGSPHQFRNESGRDGIFLVIFQPPGQGDRLPAEP
jgi:mannose-6-phosphate isomerase-like protein (cupin superfamily)